MNRAHAIVGLSVVLLLVGPSGSSATEKYLVEARSLMGQGRFSDALDHVKAHMDVTGETERLYDLLVEAGQCSGRSDDVVSFLHSRIREGKGVVRAMSALGQLYMCSARWGEAYDHFERSIALGGYSARTYAGMQAAYEKLHGTEDAISHLLALSHTEELNGGIWYALALAYWGQWDLHRALSAVDQSIAVGMRDPRVNQLRAGILCSMRPDVRHRAIAAQELAGATGRTDADGEAFMRWVLMTAFEAGGYPDSASQMQREAVRFTRERGQLGWLAHFALEDARDRLADGKIQDALFMADSATCNFERAGDHDGVLSAHSLRMSILFESCRFAEGLDYCFRILGQLDGHSDPRLLAGASIDAAWILSRIGAQRIALILGIRAESILEKISYAAHDNCRLSATLGSIHAALGDNALARRYVYSALRSVSTFNARDQLRASCEGSVGDLLASTGDTAQARRHYVKQWEIATAIGNRGEQKSAALSLARTTNIRSNAREMGRWAKVALSLSILAADRSSEKECHLMLGRLAEDRGDTCSVRREYRSAVLCLEELRTLRYTCALMRETREWYIEQHFGTIQALVRSGAIGDAVGLLEQARRDVNLHGHGRMEEVIDGDASVGARNLLRQQRAASSLLHEWVFSTSLNRVVYSESAIRGLGDFFVRVSPALIKEFFVEAREDIGRVSRSRTNPMIAARIPYDDVILDVVCGREETEVFAMTRDTLVHRTIHAGKRWFAPRIEMTAMMGSSTPRVPGEKSGLAKDVLFVQIGDSLLQGLAEVIRPRKHIVVVGDGLHSHVPFEALSLPGGDCAGPLIRTHAVSYQSSMGTPQRSDRSAELLNARLLIIADASWKSERNTVSGEAIDLVLAGHVGPVVHEELPGGRAEVKMLEGLFGSRIDVHVGSDASKETFMASVSGYPLVHISTHSVVRKKDYPEHVLFLSPSSVSNGEIGIADILSLDLSTSLVVLPTCYSGRPSEIGDVESLAHSFLDAGAKSVLAARWPIDDKIAVEFLREFYVALTEGYDRSTAMQRSMNAMMAKGYSDRSVWAGFQLFGDGGVLPNIQKAGTSQANPWWSTLVVSITLLSVAAGILWARRKSHRLSHPDRKRRE